MRVLIDTRGTPEQPSRSTTHLVLGKLFAAPWRAAATALALAAIAGPTLAEQAFAAGPDDSEIRIGNTMPYTGPAAAYGVIGKVISAYFDKVNAEGGVNGRRIRFISYDDSYSPPKTVELVRKLVEQDGVLLMFGSVGGATSAAVRPYLNAAKVPQLFNASGPAMWDQPREYPWTMGWQPNYQTEGHIYAQYLLENHPRGKIAVLFQDDAFGNDAVKGLKDRRRGTLQGDGFFDRRTDRQAQGFGGRHLYQLHDPEIRDDRNPARRRTGLEAGSYP
jgi:ABC-type branched-subunit amino acid transport system substrate-binding protein